MAEEIDQLKAFLASFGQDSWREGSRADYVTASDWTDHVEVELPVLKKIMAAAAHSDPVAWRVKDFADGWILCHTEKQALLEAESAGNLVQALGVIS
jgi:hypothetical protein